MQRISHNDLKLPFGSNKCKCSTCVAYFGGVRAFEMHRYGRARDCAYLAPYGVRDKHGQPILRLNESGYWVRRTAPVHLRQPAVRVAA